MAALAGWVADSTREPGRRWQGVDVSHVVKGKNYGYKHGVYLVVDLSFVVLVELSIFLRVYESTASGEEPREDTSSAMDHADVMQQPYMLLFEGSQHITPLPVFVGSMASGEEPRENSSPTTNNADVSQKPDMPLFEGSPYITPPSCQHCREACDQCRR
ncbi:hypothetical protein O3P69_010894 [Scylla paramamosain]|uniref:Uncharacterized protein n=1 Tax=Scylla paramamosain TaxID=85552 RepID=A0AAW0TIU9_SCYPA